jgi:predicted nicotinamide N-methyase
VARDFDHTAFWQWRACCNTAAALVAAAPWLVAGQRVIELGAGVALPSCVALAVGAADVMATDGNGDVVPIAAGNLAATATQRAACGGPPCGRHGASRLRWGDTGDEARVGGGWDVALASDVLWLKTHDPAPIHAQAAGLFAAARRLLAPTGVLVLTWQTRARGMLGDLLDAAHDAGLTVSVLTPSAVAAVWPSAAADSALDGTTAGDSGVRVLLAGADGAAVAAAVARGGWPVVDDAGMSPAALQAAGDVSAAWLARRGLGGAGEVKGVGRGALNPLWRRA